LFKTNYKNQPPIHGIGTCSIGIPSLSLRLKVEHIYPFFNKNYQEFRTNIFQINVGLLLHLHGISGNRFNTLENSK
jgi:hypothetical protein